VVHAVRELVALEEASQLSRETITHAQSAIMASQPLSTTASSKQCHDQPAHHDDFVDHIVDNASPVDRAQYMLAGMVKRFMQLFDCSSLEGVLATMNKVRDGFGNSIQCYVADVQKHAFWSS
jgi:hypothetical protein